MTIPMYYGNLLTDDRPVVAECAAGFDLCKRRIKAKPTGMWVAGPIQYGDVVFRVPAGAVDGIVLTDELVHSECWQLYSEELLSATRVQAGVE